MLDMFDEVYMMLYTLSPLEGEGIQLKSSFMQLHFFLNFSQLLCFLSSIIGRTD